MYMAIDNTINPMMLFHKKWLNELTCYDNRGYLVKMNSIIAKEKHVCVLSGYVLRLKDGKVTELKRGRNNERW